MSSLPEPQEQPELATQPEPAAQPELTAQTELTARAEPAVRPKPAVQPELPAQAGTAAQAQTAAQAETAAEAGRVVRPERRSGDRRSGQADRRGEAERRRPDPSLFQLKLPAASAAPVLMLAEERAAAKAQGYAAGWAAGNRQVREAHRDRLDQAAAQQLALEEELAARLQQALRAVSSAAGRLERTIAPVTAETDEQVLRAALQLTRVLLGRELALTTQPGLDALRRALVHTPQNRPVTVWLSPADLAALTDNGGTALHTVDGREVTLLADPTLATGDAIAECDAIRVDARLGAALERLAEALQ